MLTWVCDLGSAISLHKHGRTGIPTDTASQDMVLVADVARFRIHIGAEKSGFTFLKQHYVRRVLDQLAPSYGVALSSLLLKLTIH